MWSLRAHRGATAQRPDTGPRAETHRKGDGLGKAAAVPAVPRQGSGRGGRWCTDAGEPTVLIPPGRWCQVARMETGFATRIMRLSTSAAMGRWCTDAGE